MIDIRVRSDFKKLTRALTDLARKQVPFATAQALNSVAARVKLAEQQNIRATFKKPTPFTQNSMGISKASKANPVATVFVKAIAAKYLEPYETGGVHKLPGRALLNPKNLRLNQFGQLSKGTLARLKAMPNVFIGPVKTKTGVVNGVWKRAPRGERRMGLIGTKGKLFKVNGQLTSLKLILRFGDALPVNKKLNYGKRAEEIVNRFLVSEFEAALVAAMKSAK